MHCGNSMAMTPELVCSGVQSMMKVCRAAWRQGFMAGFSGNASLRLAPDMLLVTAAGTAKGYLEPRDCILLYKGAPTTAHGPRPSSECGLHIAVYAACAPCGAILHTHPPHMQAVEIRLAQAGNMEREFLDLPLFESEFWRQKLFFAPPLPPGSQVLASSAAQALPTDVDLPCAIWLGGHGLCALADTLEKALALTEELEHLARVQLLAM